MEIFDKKNKKLGFTLIELLVVIAIIGILAAIVLISLQGARERARDGRIISNMSQLRSASEVYYGGQTPNSYTNFCTATTTVNLFTDIALQGSTATSCHATAGTEFCTSAQLNNNEWWCVDSNLVSKQFDSDTCTLAVPQLCE